MRSRLLSFAGFLALTGFAFPAAAQLQGWDTAPGSSCAGFAAGATRITADADQDGAEVTLVCDGSTWNATGGGGSAAGNDGEIQFNSGGTLASDNLFRYTEARRLIFSSDTNLFIQGGVETTEGLRNVAIGPYALDNLDASCGGNVNHCDNNTAIGYAALTSNTTGYRNTAAGRNALANNTTGSQNTAVGDLALNNSTTANQNTAIGNAALQQITTGDQNTAVGQGALQSSTTGSQNMALGYRSLYYNQTGNYNAALGYGAGIGVSNVTNTSSNVFVGYRSGAGITTGGNNTMLGYQAGDSVTTGTRNILIGYDVDLPSATTNEHLNIGNLIYGDLGITSGTPRVGIGTASPASMLSIGNGTGNATAQLWGLGGSTVELWVKNGLTYWRHYLSGSDYVFETPTGGVGSIWRAIGSNGDMQVYKRLGVGASPSAGFDVRTGITAASGTARGVQFAQTLTAAANSDTLTALRIAPTFTNGAFTGVKNNGLIVESGRVGIGTSTPSSALEVAGDIKVDVNGALDSHQIGHLQIGYQSSSDPWLQSTGSVLYLLDDISIGGSGNITTKGTGNNNDLNLRVGRANRDIVFFTSPSTNETFVETMRIKSSGDVGIGTASPQSTLHVPDGKYLQAEDNNAGAPPSADCDADAERGRLSIDTSNNRLYVCNGASRGWDYTALSD